MSEQLFYILSVKWTHRRVKLLPWWCQNSAGYTFRLDGTRKPAGKYTCEQVESSLRYYHNGTDTLALPCDTVDTASMPLSASASRSIDQTDMSDRVVHFDKMVELKRAGKAWLAPLKGIDR